MSLLNYDKGEYLARTLKAKLIFEAQLTRRLMRLFKEYSGTVYTAYVQYGAPYFPESFKVALGDELTKHYALVGRYFSKFNRVYRAKQKKAYKTDTIDTKIKIKLQNYYDSLVLKRAEQITYTTNTELMRYAEKLAKKTDEDGFNLSKTQIAKYLKEILDTRSEGRSHSIAITETTNVAEKAKEIEIEELIADADEDELADLAGVNIDPDELDAILEFGGAAALSAGMLSIEKTWNTVVDGNTRPEHAEADGQSVPIGDPFEVGGEDLMYPGDESGSPENTINCRCTVSYDI